MAQSRASSTGPSRAEGHGTEVDRGLQLGHDFLEEGSVPLATHETHLPASLGKSIDNGDDLAAPNAFSDRVDGQVTHLHQEEDTGVPLGARPHGVGPRDASGGLRRELTGSKRSSPDDG